MERPGGRSVKIHPNMNLASRGPGRVVHSLLSHLPVASLLQPELLQVGVILTGKVLLHLLRIQVRPIEDFPVLLRHDLFFF